LFGQKGIHVAGVVLTYARLLTVVLAIGLAVGLRILLFRTRLGVVDAGVLVDNRGLASLVGARSELVSSFSWALGCSLAALAGILLAPDTGMSTSGPLTLLDHHRVCRRGSGPLSAGLPLTYLGAAILALSVAVLADVPAVRPAVGERAGRDTHRDALRRAAPASSGSAEVRPSHHGSAARNASRRFATPRDRHGRALRLDVGSSACSSRRTNLNRFALGMCHRARRAVTRAAHRLGRARYLSPGSPSRASVRSRTRASAACTATATR